MHRTRWGPGLGLALLVLGIVSCESSQATREERVAAGINTRFLDEDLEVDEWLKRFEVESREIFRERQALLEAVRLEPGMAVADIGAGTGLFLAPFSRSVGPEGRVYAVEISPAFVEHLGRRAEEEGLDNVEVVLCAEDSVSLPAQSIDVAFICDTYHHFEFPISSMRSIHTALRPGGRVVIIDFIRIPGQSREWVLEHVRAGEEVFTAEIESVGFQKIPAPAVPLAENYFIQFQKP